ncbi:hypothetical protein [Spirosoma areae]
MPWACVTITQGSIAPAFRHIFRASYVVKNGHVFPGCVNTCQQYAGLELTFARFSWFAVIIFPAFAVMDTQAHTVWLSEQVHYLIKTEKFRADILVLGKTAS